MDIMNLFLITHPAASVSRGIEAIVIKGRNSKSLVVQSGCALLSRAISVSIFPVFLLLELTFKRVPKLIFSLRNPEKRWQKFDKIVKYALGILSSPLGLYSPDGPSGLFLKSPHLANAVCPFGVEHKYGITMQDILFPTTKEALQVMIKEAKREGFQVSIIGAGMSQGTQTVPINKQQTVINTKYLKKITFAKDKKTVCVQSGATWEELQLELDKIGKSAIVKQASDLFSIGGSIGINCHGWAHTYGAIASSVKELTIIDAKGDVKTLRPEDEQFGCMFGTLGYFGVIVDATLEIVDNEYLVEKTQEVSIDEFIQAYAEIKKKDNVPLFGGRLVLDSLDGNPLRTVCMVSFEKDASREGAKTPPISKEPKWGTRLERIGLKLFSHLPNFSAQRLISWFWKKEKIRMFQEKKLTRNEALHPPINAFKMLHNSHLHTQWLQEFFIKEENLPTFLDYLGAQLKANGVRLINATIRPTPQDRISILPYAEQKRHAVVISFSQLKTEEAMKETQKWIENVTNFAIRNGDIYYQAYMPFATREQFEACYTKERVENLRTLKQKYDPEHLFGNAHTKKYFDAQESI